MPPFTLGGGGRGSIKCAVPGPNGGLIIVRPTNKKDIPTDEARAKAELAKKKGKGIKVEKKK